MYVLEASASVWEPTYPVLGVVPPPPPVTPIASAFLRAGGGGRNNLLHISNKLVSSSMSIK